MRIFAEVNGTRREAYKVGGVSYKCFPPGSNMASDAREFSTIEEAAKFLQAHSGWGIRMNPGSAIVYKNIKISA
jgi:hypothetical protein